MQGKGLATGVIKHRARITAFESEKAAQQREFERLYRECYGAVYGYVRVRMSCDADAEDVVAEAFMKAARSFASFDPSRAKFGTWVTTIARNCMVSHFRKQRPTTVLDDAPQSAFAVAPEQEATDDLLTVKRLLACLDDEERELIALKYREGLRNVEIANQMGMNASTVATKVARAIEKMRRVAEKG